MAVSEATHDAAPATCWREPGGSVVRLCCAMRRLVHALAPPVPYGDQQLPPCSQTCNLEPSRTEGSPWRSGCGAS